ncbi:protein jag [Cerasibacillus terrae]|uniref:RNA-binding protein KhpB n=1 Tax=Cerasibacillus terrae TaxID=2498845 RepID=A0A5C8NQ16_9BACI|nr:RNA-binding cell elongation regulator Jag/EloR [Cerasibacillus terrae]TXL63392.1 protein jag [Cerasibacillus terrae]
MRQVTASGQTVEDAVQSAMEQLNTEKDHVDIEVIDEGRKGILGLFGSKPAIVKVTLRKNPILEAEKYLRTICQQMEVDVDIEVEQQENRVTFHLSSEKVALLIGKRGQTLNALQYLVHLMINRSAKVFYVVVLDAEGYRKRRKETLEILAFRMSERAKRIKRKVKLEPMPAFERKIIHTALQEDKDVETMSDGKEPYRHIIIKPI